MNDGSAPMKTESNSTIRMKPVPTNISLLQLVTIPEPCLVPWDQMEGDSKVRFCSRCEKSVYNLSAMTSEEADRVIRENGGQLCGQIQRRHDGSIITQRPISHWRIVRWLSAAAAAVSAMFALHGCRTTGGRVAPKGATGGSIAVSPHDPCAQPQHDANTTRGEIMVQPESSKP
jgi:hypothetical protein